MLRPLLVDCLWALVPCIAVLAVCAAGTRAWRWPRSGKVTAGAICGLVGILPFAGLIGARGASISSVASRFGGVTILMGLLALFLVSVALAAPKRSIRPSILALVLAVAAGVVVLEGASPLIWRSGFGTMWSNLPDQRGAMQQSNGMTCAAASGAMLLARYGVERSEGELAYVVGTSLFGTDQYELARGLGRLGAGEGRTAFLTFNDAVALGRPFIAYIWTDIGRHAVLVELIGDAGVLAIDPRFGGEKEYSRGEFEAVWTGIAIWLDATPAMSRP